MFILRKHLLMLSFHIISFPSDRVRLSKCYIGMIRRKLAIASLRFAPIQSTSVRLPYDIVSDETPYARKTLYVRR